MYHQTSPTCLVTGYEVMQQKPHHLVDIISSLPHCCCHCSEHGDALTLHHQQWTETSLGHTRGLLTHSPLPNLAYGLSISWYKTPNNPLQAAFIMQISNPLIHGDWLWWLLVYIFISTSSESFQSLCLEYWKGIVQIIPASRYTDTQHSRVCLLSAAAPILQ